MERSGYANNGEDASLKSGGASIEVGKEACTPNPAIATTSKKQQTAKKIAALVKNPSALKTKSQLQSSTMKTKAQLLSSTMKSAAGTPHLSQENQAIKRQKLEGGRTRQVPVTNFVLFKKFTGCDGSWIFVLNKVTSNNTCLILNLNHLGISEAHTLSLR